VYIVGIYDTLDKAKNILYDIIPDYKPNYRNSVSGCGRIGWINVYELNESIYNPTKLTCNQPHTSVNLFNQ
jgi:hypothetical protein